VVGEVEAGGEAGLVGEGVGREEHSVGQLGREADLAEARDDLVEARGDVRGGPGVGVGVVLERVGLEPEPGLARRAGGGREELVLERGKAPMGKGEDMFNWLQDSPLVALIASFTAIALLISPLETLIKQMAELEARVARLEARQRTE
jgi:hypothetical protein